MEQIDCSRYTPFRLVPCTSSFDNAIHAGWGFVFVVVVGGHRLWNRGSSISLYTIPTQQWNELIQCGNSMLQKKKEPCWWRGQRQLRRTVETGVKRGANAKNSLDRKILQCCVEICSLVKYAPSPRASKPVSQLSEIYVRKRLHLVIWWYVRDTKCLDKKKEKWLMWISVSAVTRGTVYTYREFLSSQILLGMNFYQYHIFWGGVNLHFDVLKYLLPIFGEYSTPLVSQWKVPQRKTFFVKTVIVPTIFSEAVLLTSLST